MLHKQKDMVHREPGLCMQLMAYAFDASAQLMKKELIE
jgi:hypothetical protein